MKKYTGHLLTLAALLTAASVAWAQAPMSEHASPLALPPAASHAEAPVPAPGEDDAWMSEVNNMDESDLFAWMVTGDDEPSEDARAPEAGRGGPDGTGGGRAMQRMGAMGGMPGGMRALRGGMGMRTHMHQMMAEHLGLSDGQREKMRDIHERQARRNIQTRADLQLAQMDLRQMLRAERVDRGAIDAQIDRIARLKTDQAHARMATMLDAREVLTSEQREKLKAMRMHGPMAGDGPRDMHAPRAGEARSKEKPRTKDRW